MCLDSLLLCKTIVAVPSAIAQHGHLCDSSGASGGPRHGRLEAALAGREGKGCGRRDRLIYTGLAAFLAPQPCSADVGFDRGQVVLSAGSISSFLPGVDHATRPSSSGFRWRLCCTGRGGISGNDQPCLYLVGPLEARRCTVGCGEVRQKVWIPEGLSRWEGEWTQILPEIVLGHHTGDLSSTEGYFYGPFLPLLECSLHLLDSCCRSFFSFPFTGASPTLLDLMWRFFLGGGGECPKGPY